MEVYIGTFEKSNVPFHTDVRAFATEFDAKNALKEYVSDFIKMFPNTFERNWKSIHVKGEMSLIIQINEGEAFYATIKKVNVESSDKPCPFCEGHSKIHVCPEGFYMQCENCGSRTKVYPTRKECHDNWNNRK